MTTNTSKRRTERKAGDIAVDGLIAGLIAGLAMALFLALAGALDGRPPLTTLSFFDPARAGNWPRGLLAHLAVAAIYGVIFALLARAIERIRPALRQSNWLLGMVYGLLLLGVARGLLLPAIPSPLAQIPLWQIGIAHLLYGLVLGLWLSNND